MGDGSCLVGINTDTTLGPGEATQSRYFNHILHATTLHIPLQTGRQVTVGIPQLAWMNQVLSRRAYQRHREAGPIHTGGHKTGREDWQRQRGRLLQLGTIKEYAYNIPKLKWTSQELGSQKHREAGPKHREAGLKETGKETWQRQGGRLQLGTIKEYAYNIPQLAQTSQ